MVVLRRAGVVGVLVLASLIPAAANSAPPPLRVSQIIFVLTAVEAPEARPQVSPH